MVDRLAGKALVDAPALSPYPQTLLSVLESLGLLHDAPAGSHLQNGVYWESEAVDGGDNDPVVYTEGSFSSQNKTNQHTLALTEGFAFELSRYVTLGIAAGGTLAEQQARAVQRFEVWESFDVEQNVKAYFEANDVVLAGAYKDSEAAAAVLIERVAEDYPYRPMLFSGRGVSVKLLKDSAIELAGGIYAPGSGFGGDADATGKLYATGTVSIWRTPAEIHVVAEPGVNEIGAIVERAYYVVVDGPVFSATATFGGVA